jgi:iron complex transport system permease protein
MLKSPHRFIYFVLLPLTVATLLVMPWLGEHKPALDVILRPAENDLDAMIFWQIRVPRVLLAMFRNPLATPFTLGVAGGASLGVTLSIFLGLNLTILGVSGISLSALVGAMGAIAIVYVIARATGNISPNTMLLGGVAISFFFSSLILLLQYLGDMSDSFRIIRVWIRFFKFSPSL